MSVGIAKRSIEVPEEPSKIVSAFACVKGKKSGGGDALAKMWNTRIELYQSASVDDASLTVIFDDGVSQISQPLKNYRHSNSNGFIISSIQLDGAGNVPNEIVANDKFTNVSSVTQTIFSGPVGEGLESVCLKFDIDRGSSMVFGDSRTVFVKFTCTKRSGDPSVVNTQHTRWGLLTMEDASALVDITFTWIDMSTVGSQLTFS